jgi:hypothetical protein
MNSYTVQFRDEHADAGKYATIRAYRVEGWREDYAFFGDGAELRSPTDLVPRETVLRVWRNIPPIEEDHPPEESDESGCAVYWMSQDGLLRGQEGPYISREQAEARGEELGRVGYMWSIG